MVGAYTQRMTSTRYADCFFRVAPRMPLNLTTGKGLVRGARKEGRPSLVVSFRQAKPTPAQEAALRALFDRLLTGVEAEELAPRLEGEPANPTHDQESQ